MKVAYHLPAMGGLTAGVSFADSGTSRVLIKQLWVQNILWKLVVHAITLGYASYNYRSYNKDTDETNMGLKVVSGDLSLIVSQGTL